MSILMRGTGRTTRSFGLLCLVGACVAIAACESKAPVTPTQPPPVDPDPKPTSVAPLLFTFHTINDSTLAVEYTVRDTVPFDTAYVGLESFSIRNAVPLVSGPGAQGAIFEVKRDVFGPARYSVHVTDTLTPRTPPGNWTFALVLRKIDGRFSEDRFGKVYIGPSGFSLTTVGLPAQPLQQPALELLLRSVGAAPVRALRVYVDSGTPEERSYGPASLDSVQLKSSSPNVLWHVWAVGPMTNGRHTLTLSGRDSLGRLSSVTQPLDVAMPTPAYAVRAIEFPGAIDTRAEGLNTSGTVVGTYRSPDTVMHAFRWAAGQLDSLPSTGPSRAGLVSDAGVIVGVHRTGTTDSLVAWRSSTRTALAPSQLNTPLRAVSDQGDVLFDFANIYRNARGVERSPILFTNGMNNMGMLVGANHDGRDALQNAVGFDGATFGVNPPASSFDTSPLFFTSRAAFVNDRNQIIGVASSAPVPFLFEKGKPSYWLVNQLGLGRAIGMSRWTLVLGQLTDGRIAVWQIGGGVTLPALDSEAWTIDELNGINENGQIIAHGVNKVTGRKAALFLDPR